MKLATAVLSFLFASVSQAAVNGLACTVSGSQVISSIDLSARNVGTATAATFTAILKEDAEEGTYVTYVKLNIKYNPKSPAPLELTTVTSAEDVLTVAFQSPYSANLKIPSRIGNEAMTLNLECNQEHFSYLLNPAFDHQQNPLNAFQNAAFTLPQLLIDLLYGVYFHSPTASESEFLAQHFCTEGDQPQESAVCIRSHIADGVDEDGVPYSIEVCDEYRVDQLEPLTLQIKPCE